MQIVELMMAVYDLHLFILYDVNDRPHRKAMQATSESLTLDAVYSFCFD